MENMYIYESPDKGNTIYRRQVGKIERELIRKDGVTFKIDPETETRLKGLMEKYAEDLKNRNSNGW